MSREWSDYRNAVYGYLKNYTKFQGQAANLEMEIRSIKEELKSLCDIKPVKYGDEPSGGFNELSPMEQIVFRKGQLENRLAVLAADLERISGLLQRIDNAMRLIGETAARIIRLKFVERKKWLIVSRETQYSERNCQALAEKAVKEITATMFPESVAGQMRLNFVFIDSRPPQE